MTMSKHNILLVEDELSLAMVLQETIQSQGYEVILSSDGEAALKQFYEKKPNLVILDIMLPKSNGISVAKTIRETDQNTPIIFLTAKSQVKDVVAGFEAGGNDYLRKPFSMEELLVRMKVMLSDRRLLDFAEENTEEIHFTLGAYSFDSNKQLLIYQGREITLTARESELLKLFCQNQNRIITKKTILMKVWGDDSFFNSRSMDVFVSKLRKHLKQETRLKIMNIRGHGYKLIIG